MTFHRIAVVNRGEPAVRLVHAARELSLEEGRELRTIALYTDADADAMFVREADESYPLGPVHVPGPVSGYPVQAYLSLPILNEAMTRCGADAVWVGWGFVAERHEFAAMCADLGIAFIGPAAKVLRLLDDKIAAKRAAEAAGIATTAWSGGPVNSPEDARLHAGRLGYPLMVKAASGSGPAIRRVNRAEELEAALQAAREEAVAHSGNPAVYLEAMVRRARLIEVQIAGDQEGTVWDIGVRDCTVQRRHRKVLEEAPSPVLTPEQDAEVRAAAVRMAESIGYDSVGTVEFLYDQDSKLFTFKEFNARLQVEHPITEVTTGLDLVKLQLRIAAGEPLVGPPPVTFGHAIEARLAAEDVHNGFAPAPGLVRRLHFPAGPGLRIDTGVEEGDTIPTEFEPVIGKIVAHGVDRAEALARLRRALTQGSVVIAGGTSNRALLQALTARPELQHNEIDTGWVDRLVATGETPSTSLEGLDVALCAAALEVYASEEAKSRARFFTTAERGRPEVNASNGHPAALVANGQRYEFTVLRLGPTTYRISEAAGPAVELKLRNTGPAESRLSFGSTTHRVLTSTTDGTFLIEVDGVPHTVVRDDGGVARAPMPSVVVAVPVQPGDVVAVGDPLAVVEAMKMESAVRADTAGRVREVLVRPNEQVGAGEPLVVLEPMHAPVTGEIAPRVDLSRLTIPELGVQHIACQHRLTRMRRLLLGYDIAPDLPPSQAVELCPDEAMSLDERRPMEDEILSTFIDIISLYRRNGLGDDLAPTERRSAEEYLGSYLRDIDAQGRALPAPFLVQLLTSLKHFGVDSLEPTPALHSALYRIAKSGQRRAQQSTPVVQLLQRRLERPLQYRDSNWRALLDRITEETRNRLPVVHDLAHEVRYRTFDLPMLEDIRNATYATAQDHITLLAADPDGPQAERHVKALVDCPQPLKSTLSAASRAGSPRLQQRMLEVMTRRYYRIRPIGLVDTYEREGMPFATTTYDLDNQVIHVISTHVDHDRLADACRVMGPQLAALPAGHDAMVELYEWRDEAGDEDAARAELLAMVEDTMPAGLRRVVVATSGLSSDPGIGGVRHVTFRPGADGHFAEDRVVRGLHPMMGKRLQLWRLKNFDITRLPSVEDVYLFHGVARTNPRDERLFVLAEVRDFTPIRNDVGRVVALPEFERIYLAALNALREAQNRQPGGKRLPWNRLMLHVWPVIDLPSDDLQELAQRLAPATEGLGLEKVAVYARLAVAGAEARPTVLQISNPEGRQVVFRVGAPNNHPLEPLTPYTQKVVQLRRRGLVYPWEFLKMLVPAEATPGSGVPRGTFVEMDLDENNELVEVNREPGLNAANIIIGIATNYTARYPEGVQRVAMLSDPSRGMGNLAEPECRRIMAALDLAEERGLPVEWYAISSGALIAMDSGTENMDWIADVLRALIEFTQRGFEINIIIAGITVGGQPYWNAEATMLLHTKGILVMIPGSSMVLTGKQSLDYSGGVSAEDNQGIGGYERVMGPNGQAQYFAHDLADACRILLAHYDHAYVAPGETFPRRAVTSDPIDRDVCTAPHGGEFATVGEVFSMESNPNRKKPFEIRRVMAAAVDADHPTLERWFGMEDAEVAVVWDAHVGGYPVCMLGLESKPIPRMGVLPADGPDTFTSGTLFPLASKKVARAINATSGSRPLVVLANLSGFDGSPESMRRLQLEYGAEIGRAVVNFQGPIVFVVVSRYHGGAFVVFSAALNKNMEVAAIAGSHASVIGGAPAAAVVFSREVDKRTAADPRVVELKDGIAAASGAQKTALRSALVDMTAAVRSEKLGEVASTFDGIHNIQRAVEMGSVHRIIDPHNLRPYLVDALERGMKSYEAKVNGKH